LSSPFSHSSFWNGTTVSYNELLQGFESFHDYKPRIYVNTKRRVLSESTNDNQEIHEHNIGECGTYYNEQFASELTIVLNPTVDYATVFHNIELSSEVSIDDVDQANSTLSSMEFWNNYQSTGKIPLVVNTNIKRRMRKWRAQIPRDNKARLRSTFVFLKVRFENNSNKRLVLHDIITYSTPTNG